MPSRKLLVSLLLVAATAGLCVMAPLTSRPDRETARKRITTAGASSSPPKSSASERKDTAKTSSSDATPVSLSSPQGKTPEQPETFTEAFTEPYRDIAVAASEMGTLSVVKVREGDIVKQGDIIAVMQDDVLRASLEVARRSMSVEGILKSATADFELRKSEQEKLVQLRDRNHASQQEVDRIDTELKVAEARLLSVREELEVKLLEFRRIESQLEQRIVRAPIDGLISDVLREPGEFVSPSEPTIARLVQLDSLLIVFSVPLAQRKDIMKHQKVTLTIGESRQTAEGIVEYVSPTPDSSNSSVRVKVRLPNDEYRFQSGERAVLELNSIRNPSIPPVQPDSTPIARREQ